MQYTLKVIYSFQKGNLLGSELYYDTTVLINKASKFQYFFIFEASTFIIIYKII